MLHHLPLVAGSGNWLEDNYCNWSKFLKYIFCQNHPYFFKSSKPLFLLSRIQVLTKDTKSGPGVNQTTLWMMPRAVWLFASCPCFPTSSGPQWRKDTVFFRTVFPAVSLSPSTSLSLRHDSHTLSHGLACRSSNIKHLGANPPQDPVLRFKALIFHICQTEILTFL